MNDTPTTPAIVPPPRPRRRKSLFIVAAIACGLLPLILLETGLRLAGVGRDVTYQDPLVGFSRVAPLFELGDRELVYQTVRSRQVLFEKQMFAATKPADGFRIFCLGGSTVRGRPYTTQTAFPRWLQLELSARDPAHTYEVINCGGLSYASYRLAHILQEVLTYDPDLIIIATGHNEFLEDRTYGEVKHRSGLRAWCEDRLHQLRTVRLLRGLTNDKDTDGKASGDDQTVLPELVEARLDEASGYASYHRDDEWADAVRHHFDQSLRTMIGMCEAAAVPLMIVKLGSNVRDCPPFKSEHRPSLTVEQQRDWQAHVDAAGQQEAADAALASYRSALAIDGEHALLRFRIARLLDRLGRPDEAVPHYLAARELDVCPLRMRQSFAEALESIASETHTPLIDADRFIASQCDTGLPGNDWYMDHVHPTIEAHQLIASTLVSHIAQESWSPQLARWTDDSRRIAWQDHWNSLGPNYHFDGFERVHWLENWARRRRLYNDTLPRDPASHLRYGDRLWNFGHQDEAWEHYAEALETDPSLHNQLQGRCDRLRNQGRRGEAVQLQDRLAAPM